MKPIFIAGPCVIESMELLEQVACKLVEIQKNLGIEIYLNKQTLIDRAHRRNIAVQYWTINDADEMRELIELGCDCIMTDNPELLKSVLEEYK